MIRARRPLWLLACYVRLVGPLLAACGSSSTPATTASVSSCQQRSWSVQLAAETPTGLIHLDKFRIGVAGGVAGTGTLPWCSLFVVMPARVRTGSVVKVARGLTWDGR